ncbi:MAG: calcium/sodium antiporter [archaeon]
MIWSALFFIVGFILLIYGSDVFVVSASRLAKKIGVSGFIIGITIVAFATSIPEFASTTFASIHGFNDIIVGNILGSNIINISLILGISALFTKLKIEDEVISRDAYVMVFITIIFFIFALNQKFSLYEGIIFLLIYAAYILFLFKQKKSFQAYGFEEFLVYFAKFEYVNDIQNGFSNNHHKHMRKKKWLSILKELGVMALSLGAITIGANGVVSGSIALANYFHLSQTLIGYVLMALGTSLPELSIALTAAKKGHANMAVGNLIGSNIANLMLILGVSSLINPIIIAENILTYVIPFMLFVSILSLLFIQDDTKISKIEGYTLIFMYVFFTSAMIYFRIL